MNHKRKAAQANTTELEKLSENVYNISFFAVVSEVNLVGNTKEWWVDTGATDTYVRIRRCSLHMKQLMMEDNSLWKIPPLPKLKAKEGLY